MKKVTCLFVAFVLSLMMIQINDARGQVIIGDGTVVGQWLPINAFYGYSYSQVIYLASEIDASGVINSISWNFKGTSLTKSNDWTIYLGHTTKTAFDSNSDWIPIGELTQVYSGEFTSPTGPGWITIPISNFTYDGIRNLVIAVDENKYGFNGSTDDFYCTAVSGNRGIIYSSGVTNPNPVSPPPTGAYLRAYIANVTLGGIQQACPRVINLTATNISSNSALLGWTRLGNETLWNIEYGPKGFELGQGTLVSGVTTNPYLLTGLSPDTEYEFYVQADCGSGEVSLFTGPKVFQTDCAPYSVFPWSESFETVTIPALPFCWYKIVNSKWVTTNNSNGIYDADARTGTQFLRIPSSSTNDHIWTPGFSMEAGTSYEFSFWWAGDGYAGWTGDVFINTSQDLTGAVQIGNSFVTSTTITDKIYRPFKYNFVPDVSDDYYFAIRVTSTSALWYLSFDDFNVQYSPSCISPSDLTVGSITTNSALLGWSPGANETVWNIEYGPVGFELGQGTLITDITSNPYLLSGLTSATKYDFYIQSDCGGGELSLWFGPASFTTECEIMELPFFQNFTGVAVGAIPVCWTRTHFNWDVQSSSSAGGKKPEMRLYWSPSFTGLTLLKSPVFNTVGKAELLLEFKHYLNHYGTPYKLGVKTSSDGITWNTVWQVSPSAHIPAETKEVIINNSDVGSPTFQFAFFFEGNTSKIKNWNIDDVKLFANEYGTLSGYVTEATRGVIEGARVFSGSYEAFTDATGYYEIADMIVDVYDVTCEADGYVSVTEVGVEIFNNEVTGLNFQLGISNISIDPEFISASAEPGGTTIETLTISNLEGTAPLTWRARVKILSDHQSLLPILTQQQHKIIGADDVIPNPSGVKPDYTDEMLDLLAYFPVVDDDGTYGFVCDGDFLYTGNRYYNGYDKYSLDGEFIEHFEISGAGKTNDLTYDGEYFYGSPANNIIYQMDFKNKTLVSTITAAGNQVRGISYDPDNDAFWITANNFSGPFKLISRTGETLQTLTTTVTGISGIAYDNVSAGGPFLWAYTPTLADQHKLVKVDLTTGAAIQTFDLMPYGIFGTESRSGGLEITNAVVPGKWTFIGCSQNDILFVVELTDDASAWVSIAPKQGVVEPGSSDQIEVGFDATNLEEGIYFANINITHNGQEVDKGVITVPVELFVGALAPPQPATLISPANNATLVSLQPEFTWIANSSAFNRLIITTGTPPNTTTIYTSPWFIGDSFDFAGTGLILDKKKNYNWQVNTMNSAGSVNSPIWKFQTIGSGIFKGLITDSYSGLPLEGVEVTTDPGNYVAFTDNTGNYTIEDVLEGDYTLTANKDGYNSAEQSGSITYNVTTFVNFELGQFLPPPSNLHAEIENIFDVHLTWSEAAKGPITLATVVDDPVTSNFGGTITLSPNGLSEPVISVPTVTRSTPVLLGYNVYRDNTLLALVTDTEYYDLDLAAGTYSYEVTAAYDQGESEPDGFVSVSILAPPTLLIAEQQGSEVFLQWKSNFVGKGVLADGRNKAKAYLDSYTGNTITEDMRLRLFGGSYQSNQVHSGIRCEVECPAGAINESELCGEELNDGCNAVPEVFEPIAIGDVICGTAWADNGSRDTDWYELIVTEPKTITWKVTAEFPVCVFILDGNNGCDDIDIIIYVFAQPCEPIIAMTTVIPGTYWLWVGNQDFYGNPCGESNNYVFELTAEDVFLPYFKLHRNDVVIGNIYNLYHYDAIVPGNEYCYSVSEVVSEGIETANSNELCVNIPVFSALAVTPGSIDENHNEPPQVTTKTLTVSNICNDPIEFDAAIVLLGKDNRASELCIDNLYTSGCYEYGDGLASWQLANVYQEIPCVDENDWYHDYTDIVHELKAGETYELTVETIYDDTMVAVWIDFNDDLELTPDELIVDFIAEFGGFTSVNVTIPADSPSGNHVLRFRTNWDDSATDPCDTYTYGNAADFMATFNTQWISIEPSAGIINVGESMDLVVTFNSADLDYGIHNADILFTSNNPFAAQPEVTVPAQLTVGEVPSQDILIPLGWSGWSAYINMMGASFENVVAPVVNDMVITQHFTEMFWPQYGINTMGNFTNDHGYISKMSAEATLTLEGMMIAPTIALNAGWNLFPILVDCNLDAAEVFGAIEGFIIGYEVAGNGIYYPAGSIATLTTLVPGKAYWVKVSGAATYTFPECIGGTKASYIAPLRHANNTPWNEPTYTGLSHIVVFDAEASVSFAKGDMIGAFTNDGACAGLTLCDGKAVSLALFADDITTLVNDGFVQGEFITFKLFRQSNDTEYILDVSYSNQAPNYDGLFEANGLSVINNVTMYATGIASQDLNSLTVYPNPSQGIFNVSVNNLFQDVNWVVTDAKGRYVLEGRLADSHQIDLRTQPKGVYFIKFTGDNVLCIKKLVLR